MSYSGDLVPVVKEVIADHYAQLPFDIGVAAVIVQGEAEGQSLEEKVFVALTIVNRTLQNEIKFQSIEEDYLGQSRKLKVTNPVERRQMEESINAVLIALELHKRREDLRDIYFFNNHGKKPSSWYKVEEVDLSEFNFKHYFFRIVGNA